MSRYRSPCAATVEPLATLGRQTQALAIDGARRNSRLDVVRHATQPSRGIVFRHGQLEIERRAAKGIFDADFHGHFEILAGHGRRARQKLPPPRAPKRVNRSAKSTSSKENCSLPPLLARPFRRRAEFLALRSRAECVVGGAFFRVLESPVGLGNLLEALLGLRLLRDIRMIFLRQPAVGLLDFLLRSAALDAECGVVVAVLHFDPVIAPAPLASA